MGGERSRAAGRDRGAWGRGPGLPQSPSGGAGRSRAPRWLVPALRCSRSSAVRAVLRTGVTRRGGALGTARPAAVERGWRSKSRACRWPCRARNARARPRGPGCEGCRGRSPGRPRVLTRGQGPTLKPSPDRACRVSLGQGFSSGCDWRRVPPCLSRTLPKSRLERQAAARAARVVGQRAVGVSHQDSEHWGWGGRYGSALCFTRTAVPRPLATKQSLHNKEHGPVIR